MMAEPKDIEAVFFSPQIGAKMSYGETPTVVYKFVSKIREINPTDDWKFVFKHDDDKIVVKDSVGRVRATFKHEKILPKLDLEVRILWDETLGWYYLICDPYEFN